MTFEEAFDNAVRAFYEGKQMTEFEKATGTPSKYTKDFFDEFEKGMRPKKVVDVEEEDLEDAD